MDEDGSIPPASACGTKESKDSPENAAPQEASRVRPVRYALHDAAERGDAEAIQKLFDEDEDEDFDPTKAPGANVEGKEDDDDDEGANEDEDEEGGDLKTLLAGIDVDEKDPAGLRPLQIAIVHQHIDCVKALVRCGAELLLHCDGSPYTHFVLHQGAFPSHGDFCLQALKILLEAEAPAQMPDRLGRTTLHIAAMHGLVDCCKAILEWVPSPGINEQDHKGWTALHYAALFKQTAVVKFFLELKVDACIRSYTKDTAAHIAAQVGWNEGLELFSATENLKMHDQGEQLPHQVLELVCASSKSKTLFVTHDQCLQHRTGPDPVTRQGKRPSPENPDRLRVLCNSKTGILRNPLFNDNVFWKEDADPAAIAHILRVHEYSYIRRLLNACGGVADDLEALGHLDADTAICRKSWDAACHAAGSVIHAIDEVYRGTAKNAFCAVRPPGHHSGPVGLVTCEEDPQGSHGFCLLNNIAIGAAYARCHYKAKVVIFDFDVHHGNGTEAIVANLAPQDVIEQMKWPMGQLDIKQVSYKPWLNAMDGQDVMFVSAHGYGSHPQCETARFYPGSGKTCGVTKTEEDTVECNRLFESQVKKPTIINTGLGVKSASEWRAVLQQQVLPRVAEFAPDLILISAGFDAHACDELNHGFLSISEFDYEWLTQQLIKIANTASKGRVVSVLEGGYRIQGALASPFACSVAAHVHQLVYPTHKCWQPEREERESEAPSETRVPEVERQLQANANSSKRSLEEDVPELPVTVKASPEPVVEAPPAESRRSKRSRVAVDYVALAKKLDEERKAAGASGADGEA